MSQDQTKLGTRDNMTDEEKLALALAMADASFEDIQDLAKFADFPKGTWFVGRVASATLGLNADNTALVIKVAFEVDSPIELAAYPGVAIEAIPEDERAKLIPPTGSLFGAQWQGPLGIQRFKDVFSPLIKSIDPLMTPRALVEMLAADSVQGITIMTSRRADKEKVVPSDTDPEKMVPVTYNELVTVCAA